MFLRFVSTVVLAPIAISAIWFGWPYFDALVLLVGLVALMEWFKVSQSCGQIGQSAAARFGWPIFGVIYIGISCISLVLLRADPEEGLALVLAFFSVVWMTDIGAYLVGRTFGGPKLAPSISPNKTWSGALGGLLCGVATGVLVARLTDLPYGLQVLILVGSLISVVSQIGDLFESWWKRHFGVKDSGNLIPGHGGILDRIDGVLLASPVAAAGHWVAQTGGLLWK